MFTTYLQQEKLVITIKEIGGFWGLLSKKLKYRLFRNKKENTSTVKFFDHKFFLGFLKIIILWLPSHNWT